MIFLIKQLYHKQQ